MSAKFIRFVTRLRDRETSKRLGIFWATGDLADCDAWENWAEDRAESICEWFNKNLKAPDLPSEHWRAVFWFHSAQQEMVRKLWELAALLEEHGVFVDFLSTNDPGVVVYRDQHQLAAIPRSRFLRR
jgi:hypothetical protein